MYVIVLKYQVPLDTIDALKDAHYSNPDGVFAKGMARLAGPLEPRTGGLIIANGERSAIEAAVASDPFVTTGVATAEILRFEPTWRPASIPAALVSSEVSPAGPVTTSHTYDVTVEWTGNLGSGTTSYRSYSRDHEVLAHGKAGIAASSDPAFRGDRARWNPEELLVASVAQCHMLWYLHLCAVGGVTVTDYVDHAHGVMVMDESGGGGQIAEVVLHPEATVADTSMVEKARELHRDVPAVCFIARSVRFPITHIPVIRVQDN
ncbi:MULTISPECIES: OsmC family protein [unclassified Streptomyces]|uniref:OsmC family protein n=1 Tax=unclassified Streptomyces TaxID=2593676 RepID=UPI003369F1C4